MNVPTTSELCNSAIATPINLYNKRQCNDDSLENSQQIQMSKVFKRELTFNSAIFFCFLRNTMLKFWVISRSASSSSNDNKTFMRLNFLTALILIIFHIQFVNTAALCKSSCRGKCNEIGDSNNTTSALKNLSETSALNLSTSDLINEISGDKTRNATLENQDYVGKNVTKNGEIRRKRESYVERRTCSSRFQLEIIVIPISIMMIPIALCTLLLCVFCCGPKDSRGKIPEKMFGVSLSQKRRKSNNDSEADELEYGDGYVQRKSSKKTRFSMNVQVFEMSLNSPRGSIFTTKLPQTISSESSTEDLENEISVAAAIQQQQLRVDDANFYSTISNTNELAEKKLENANKKTLTNEAVDKIPVAFSRDNNSDGTELREEVCKF